MKTEIQSITAKLHDIYGVYGFGSFFRGDQYNDIDILIVASPVCEDTLSLFYLLKERLEEIDKSIDIDIILLTYSEFLTKPLLEMDSLTEIYTGSEDVLSSVSDD
jgi:predicted nucleotidyltransferase